MATTKDVSIRVPFDFCKDCKEFDVEENDFYAADDLDYRDLYCSNYYICENACNLFAKDIRDKAKLSVPKKFNDVAPKRKNKNYKKYDNKNTVEEDPKNEESV